MKPEEAIEILRKINPFYLTDSDEEVRRIWEMKHECICQLHKAIPVPVKECYGYDLCPECGIIRLPFAHYCMNCGQALGGGNETD